MRALNRVSKNSPHYGFGIGSTTTLFTERLDTTSVFVMEIVKSAKNDRFSGVPVPSATKSRPPSLDTMTRESAAGIVVPPPDGGGVVGGGNGWPLRGPGCKGGDC